MVLPIQIRFERRIIRLQVEKIYSDNNLDKFKVTARNQSFIIQTNKPLLLAKGLKHKPAIWKVVEGGYHHRVILEMIVKEIEAKVY